MYGRLCCVVKLKSLSFENLESGLFFNGYVLGGNLFKIHQAFLCRGSCECQQFWIIQSKNAENIVSFEIWVTTIKTGSSNLD